MSIILLVIGLVLLIKCADMFVDGCSNVARAFGIPKLIIGLTIVAFGTSAPEAAVSVTSSLNGMNDMSLGNVVGSNICNLLLILGCSSLAGTVVARKKIITRDFLFAILGSIVLFIFSFGFFAEGNNSGVIDRADGLILLCFMGVYLYALISDALKSVSARDEKEEFKVKDIIFIIVGIVGIVLGGRLVVNSATEIATMLKVSQNVIALTIVAIGTSLPELVTSVVASRKQEDDIAIGNVVGSNIFNIFFVLGISSAISPITFGIESFYDIIVMIATGAIVYLFLLKDRKLDYKNGVILLLIYIGYMAYILMR